MIRVAIVMYLSLIVSVQSVELTCINNVDQANQSQSQKTMTVAMLKRKQKELEAAIDKYKEALEKKKEAMTTLWKTTTEIEYLMKENHIIRKQIIKHWESMKNLH